VLPHNSTGRLTWRKPITTVAIALGGQSTRRETGHSFYGRRGPGGRTNEVPAAGSLHWRASVKGINLKVARVRRGLRQEDVALGAGCSRAFISQLEHSRRVPTKWVRRYRDALSAATSREGDHGGDS
jgi:DNA-binding XRE family transcriptional regulator